MTDVLIRKEVIWIQTCMYTGRTPREDEDRDRDGTSTSQGTPEIASKPSEVRGET